MIDSGIWPLYEVEQGKFKLTYKPNKLKPVKEALLFQKRFKHLPESAIKTIQNQVTKEWDLLSKGNYCEVNEY